MGIAYNTSIVRDGLVLHLDAANVKSYPGSGTIWKDLNYQNINATMIGSVPYSAYEQAFDFSGMAGGTSGTSPLGFSISSSPVSSTDSFTISTAIKQTVNTGQTGLFSNAGGANGYRFGPSSGGIYYGVGPGWSEGVIGANTFLLNKWVVLTAVYDRSSSQTVKGYINGRLAGSVSLGTQTAMTTALPGIVKSACCSRFIGYLQVLMMHNIALTDTEVKQNFESLRGRYGL